MLTLIPKMTILEQILKDLLNVKRTIKNNQTGRKCSTNLINNHTFDIEELSSSKAT